MTFAIRDEQYVDPETPDDLIQTSFGEFANREEILDHMHRTIIENGGKVVPGSSHYVITEDGMN
jgi:hypothetical protein